MVKWLLKKIVGSKHQRELKRAWPVVKKINELEAGLQSLSVDELRAKTKAWQDDLKAIETRLDDEISQWKESELRKLSADDAQGRRDLDEQARRRKLDRMGDVYDEQAAYLEKILPEAYAVVKNGARRMLGHTYEVCDQPMTWDMVHFDVQLIGGIALHRGNIAEMATGEGKTLVATLPLYLNGLTGRGRPPDYGQ